MNVGILGSGDVAQNLAIGFLDRGDTVALGTREPAKLHDFVTAHPGTRAVSTGEAAAFGELLVIATLGSATVALLGTLDSAAFANKVVIDATNPITSDADGLHMNAGFADSLGERVQRALPQARVVKAFNTVGNEEFVQPKFSGGPPTMFIAGDDAGAKHAVRDIVTSFGWDVADVGGISSARYLEAMCMTWLMYGQVNGTWHHAFKMLT
jgi:predicted dinucleotide-binding enzyme